MQIALLVATLITVLAIGQLADSASVKSGSLSPVRIVSVKDHSIRLKLKKLIRIFEADNIKDRNVVVVSIADAFREDKVFLTNFLIRYLNAKYKNHGTESETMFSGLEKQTEQNIWVWPDIFMHDFADGEKVAIVLLDPHGMFDGETSSSDAMKLFATSLMMSSVHCFNVMNRTSDFSVFKEYQRLEETGAERFQSLILDGQVLMPLDFVKDKEGQESDAKYSQAKIQSHLNNVRDFMMPDSDVTGIEKDVDHMFYNYVDQLAKTLFSPENLIIKKINGEKVRARHLVQYLMAFTNMIDGDSLPRPRYWIKAATEMSNRILYEECLEHYNESMIKATEGDLYYDHYRLLEIHESTKEEAMKQFQSTPKLGNNRTISNLNRRLSTAIEETFTKFQLDNDKKRLAFMSGMQNDGVIDPKHHVAHPFLHPRHSAIDLFPTHHEETVVEDKSHHEPKEEEMKHEEKSEEKNEEQHEEKSEEKPMEKFSAKQKKIGSAVLGSILGAGLGAYMGGPFGAIIGAGAGAMGSSKIADRFL